jgi:Rrf2 family transcriptional regulator, iron-sulfur cluster assembly transcription factor
MLSSTCKYAIRAVIYLALHGKQNSKIGIIKISKDLEIPTPFLGKILQSLAKHKLLSSTKGPRGGFCLGKDPYEISIMDIVEIIDGLDCFSMCLLGLKSCTSGGQSCPIHSKYGIIREQIKELFLSENVGQLADHIKENHSVVVL